MIVGLGCIAHDHVLVTESTWETGKGRISHREVRFGGNVRNALAAVAGLDHRAAYLATVGTSELSNEAITDLLEHNIDTTFVERVAGADPVTSTLIITADGERYIAFDDAALATTPLPSQASVDAALTAADVLLVDASTAPPGTRDVVLAAQSRQIPVVLDAERDLDDDMRELIDLADHLVIPQTFGTQLTGEADPQAIAEKLWTDRRSAVVLTSGSAGSWCFERTGKPLHIPSFAVDVVDTTGCGDAFHGAYAVALANGANMSDRVVYASATAAVIATRQPGQRRIATPAEVTQLTGS